MRIGEDLYVRVVTIGDLREQDVNAHVMAPRVFERLVENIRQRGQLESTVYCAQPAGEGPIGIVSGHHRARAARAAGLTEIPAIVDEAPMTRSQVVAKQLAHNALVGTDDPDVLKQLVGFIESADDLLASGLPEDVLPNADDEKFDLFMPRVDFDWQTISFAALPHQVENMRDLCDRLKDRHDLVLTTVPEQFDAFVKAAADFGRLKEVRSGGTVVAMLADIARAELAAAADDEPEQDDRPEPTKPMWTKLSTVLGRDSVPTSAMATIERAIAAMEERGDIGPKNRWQALEYLAANYLAEHT